MFSEDDQLVLGFVEAQLGRPLNGYVLDFEGVKEFTSSSATYTSYGRCGY